MRSYFVLLQDVLSRVVVDFTTNVQYAMFHILHYSPIILQQGGSPEAPPNVFPNIFISKSRLCVQQKCVLMRFKKKRHLSTASFALNLGRLVRSRRQGYSRAVAHERCCNHSHTFSSWGGKVDHQKAHAQQATSCKDG